MKRLAIAFLLGAGVNAFAQTELSQKITYTSRAERAERLLANLSKAVNVPLEATNAMKGEVLVVSVQDVPLSDLLARIATATSGEWKPMEGGGYRLTQSNSLRTIEERQAIAARAAAIRSSVMKKLEPKKPGAKGEDAEMEFGMGGSKELDRIMARLDFEAIARMGSGDRLVFSTQPTRMQRAFTSSVAADVTALVKSHNEMVGKMAGEDPTQGLEEMPDFVKKMTAKMTKPIGQVSKALLIVSRMSFASFGMVQAELRLYDPQGKVAYSMPGNIEIPGTGLGSLIEDLGDAIPNGKKTQAPANAAATPVEISPDSEAMMKAFQGVTGPGSKEITLSPDLKAKIFQPENYDPLSFFPTDQVISLAKKQRKPVVALLPDDAVSMLTMVMPNRKPTVEEYERTLTQGATLKLVEDPNWLVIKPANPSEARASRLDRSALGALLRVADQKGIPSLDDIAAYSLRAPSPMEGGLGQLYVLFFVPGVMSQGLGGFTNWETLRLYGSLDGAARQNLASGGKLSFASLSAFQVEQVSKMIYGAMPVLEVDPPAGKEKESDGMPSFMRAFMGTDGDYQEEPTEILPTGLPRDGYITLKVSTEPFVSPVSGSGNITPGTMAVMDMEMLAAMNMLKDMPNMEAMSGFLPSFDRIRVGERSILAFTFQVAPKVAAHQSLNDNRMPKDGPITSLANLPESFKKLLAERTEALKKSPLGALGSLMGTGMGGTIKP